MNNFTKADLKTGMIVTYRNGSARTVDLEYHALLTNGYVGMYLSSYNHDLTGKNGNRDFDIVEVSGTIWQRKPEPKRMTKAEIEAALGYEVEIVRGVVEVNRVAKQDEWVKVSDNWAFANAFPQRIFKVERVDCAGDIYVHGGHCVCRARYVVLENYQPSEM